jgi:hypothetical protein
MTLRQPERRRQPKDLELDHEWLQLIQMEKATEEKKNQLRRDGAQKRGDPDEDQDMFWENEESFTEQNDHLDDEDMEYINVILNSFSRDQSTHKNSINPQLESFTPVAALARALASPRMPSKFNLRFNQNSTTRESEEDHSSCFSDVEEESTGELGDYFSDDEDDDTWSITDINHLEENHTPSPHTLFEWDPVISGLETINEAKFENESEADKLNYILGFSEETKIELSTWRPFIPPEHVFQIYAAQSQPLDFLSQPSSSQEPTLIQISTITTATRLTSPERQTSPPPETSLLQPKDWPSLELTTRLSTPTWTKPQTESKKTSNIWQKDFPDHPEPSKQCRHWKP